MAFSAGSARALNDFSRVRPHWASWVKTIESMALSSLAASPVFVLRCPGSGVGGRRARFSREKEVLVFENTPLARRQWTGLDDEHLASIGFVNFAFNALERKFASLVWITAGWTQEAGELVVAGMGNVSLVVLFVNLLKQELRERDDRRLREQGGKTGALFDAVRDARNDVVHTFFDRDPISGAEGYFKGTPRKGRGGGQAQIRTVAMTMSDIDELCSAISDCFESIDDLTLKLWFRRRFLAGNPSAPDHAYEQAVHGWRDPPFDVTRLTVYPRKRSRRVGARRSARPDGRPSEVGPGPRSLEALSLAAEGAESPGERPLGGAAFVAGEDGSDVYRPSEDLPPNAYSAGGSRN
jgi:hypothetical protein